MNAVYSLFFHNYYGNHDYWLNFFSKNSAGPFHLYYNIVEDSIYNNEFVDSESYRTYQAPLKESSNLKTIIYRKSSNKGKDIGGKMVLLDAYLKLNKPTEFGLFVHDKKSFYKTNNAHWAENLLKIADHNFSKKAINKFISSPETGIITAVGNLKNEYNIDAQTFISNNKNLLPKLQEEFDIYPTSFNYIAGTMFWFRMKPVVDFFSKNEPLMIREMLEKGNVTDEFEATNTHCWERLLSWIITAEGYKINSI